MSGRAIGLDLGLTKDKSVVAVLRCVHTLVVVEALMTWAPHPGEKTDLQDVEETVATLAQDAPVVLDPWQGVLMAQRLRARGRQVIEYSFTGESRRKLFGTLLDLIRTGRLRCRPHEEFRRELLGLEVQETAAGWRVDHRVGRHDDHVVAVALAAQQLGSGRAPGDYGISIGPMEIEAPPGPAATAAPALWSPWVREVYPGRLSQRDPRPVWARLPVTRCGEVIDTRKGEEDTR